MNVAKWAGTVAAALALGCAGQQSESRTTAASPRADAQGGGASEATTANQTREGQATREGQVARPSMEGRPGMHGESTSATGRASTSTASGNHVYGQVNEISDDEIEIEPAYGEPIKLKLDDQIRASAESLEEGDEVRASYDQQGGDKVAVDVEPDPAESTILNLMPSSGTTPSTSPMGSESRSGTSTGTAPMGSEPSRGSDTSDR